MNSNEIKKKNQLRQRSGYPTLYILLVVIIISITVGFDKLLSWNETQHKEQMEKLEEIRTGLIDVEDAIVKKGVVYSGH